MLLATCTLGTGYTHGSYCPVGWLHPQSPPRFPHPFPWFLAPASNGIHRGEGLVDEPNRKNRCPQWLSCEDHLGSERKWADDLIVLQNAGGLDPYWTVLTASKSWSRIFSLHRLWPFKRWAKKTCPKLPGNGVKLGKVFEGTPGLTFASSIPAHWQWKNLKGNLQKCQKWYFDLLNLFEDINEFQWLPLEKKHLLLRNLFEKNNICATPLMPKLHPQNERPQTPLTRPGHGENYAKTVTCWNCQLGIWKSRYNNHCRLPSKGSRLCPCQRAPARWSPSQCRVHLS